MNASANPLAESARERIRVVAARQPEVVRLARYLSPAVRVDAPLMRAIRQELMPASDAGIEADLWFSPLVESVSSRGFVLDHRVTAQLRRELADEGDDNHQAVLNRAAGIIAAEHRSWPPSLLLEERIIWLSLRKYATEPEKRAGSLEIETLLRQAAKAMGEDEVRGLEMARWAQRALRSLPGAALETEAALLLALGAAARLGNRRVLSQPDQQRELPRSVSWILPKQRFASTTTIHLVRTSDGVRFGDPGPTSIELSVPVTQPLFAQLSWFIGPVQAVRTVSLGQGSKFVPIPEQATDIRVRTLSGEEFHLDSEAALDTVADVDLLRACVGVMRLTSTGQRMGSLTGFLVQPDLVATVTHGLIDLARDERLAVRWQKEDIEAMVVSMLPSAELALLRLSRPITGAVVLPWVPNRSTPGPSAPWNSAGFDDTAFIRVGGTVRSVDLQGEDAGLRVLSNGGLSYRGRFLELAVDGPARPPEIRVAWSGAPIVSSGRLIGMLVAGISDNSVFYAVPADELREGVDALLLGRETMRTVFVSYGGRGRSDKDQAAATLMLEALRSVGLRAIIDTDIGEPSGKEPRFDALARITNSASVGAILATSSSHGLPAGQRSMLLLRYRQWMDPRFPVLTFTSGGGEPNENLAALIPPNTRIDAFSLDSTPRQELLRSVGAAYATLTAGVTEPDEARALAGLRERLTGYLHNSANPGETVIQQIVEEVSNGIAEIPRILGNRLLAARDEVANAAAMFSFSPELHLPLREVRLGSSSARAFSLNANQPAVARALIERAWLGKTVPRCFEVGISVLDRNPSVPAVARVLFDSVSSSLRCDLEEARWLLENSSAKFFIILFDRAARATPLTEQFLAQFPGALLFFLLGESRPLVLSQQLVELSPLSPREEMEFLRARQALLGVPSVSAPPVAAGASPSASSVASPAPPLPEDKVRAAPTRAPASAKRKTKPKKKSQKKK